MVKECTEQFMSGGACMSHGGRQKKRMHAVEKCNAHYQREGLYTGHQAWEKNSLCLLCLLNDKGCAMTRHHGGFCFKHTQR